MDITKIISANLAEWMQTTPGLDTIKKVAAKSGVGFGTVQRARNGDGNTTVQNLAKIAAAFRRRPEELLTPPTTFQTKDVPPLPYVPGTRRHERALAQTVCELAEQIDDDGLRELIGFARYLTSARPFKRSIKKTKVA